MSEELHMLQPMSLGDILDETLSLYRKNFVTFFGIALIPGIIAMVLTIPFQTEPAPISSLSQENSFLEQLDLLEGFTPPSPIAILFTALAGLLSYAALIKAIADRYLSRQSSIGSSFGFIIPRIGPYLLTLLLLIVLYILGAIPILIPIIGLLFFFVYVLVLSFMTAFLSQVFVVEDLRYMEAIKRSRELAKGNWGRIFVLALLWVVISWIVTIALLGLSGFFAQGQSVVTLVVNEIGNALVLPIFLSSLVLLYFDIRVRKEGFDLQLLAEELAARGGPPSQFPPRTEKPDSGTGL